MSMPRPKGKARAIAYKLLGKPPCLSYKPTAKQKDIDKRLRADETALIH